jgi:hypothetical protein
MAIRITIDGARVSEWRPPILRKNIYNESSKLTSVVLQPLKLNIMYEGPYWTIMASVIAQYGPSELCLPSLPAFQAPSFALHKSKNFHELI